MIQYPIITITGTKGKTTTAYIVDEVLRYLNRDTVRVDTTGHFVNGKRKSSLADSQATWGLVPSVSPGRYLYEFNINNDLAKNGVAVLEASLGSSTLSGLGYFAHKVGVFLNVYEDHLGSTDRLQSREDIKHAKRFIFERITGKDGYAVVNADDELVVKAMEHIPGHIDAKKVIFGLNFNNLSLEESKKNAEAVFTIKDNKVVLKENGKSRDLFDFSRLPWVFNGEFKPSLYNLLAALAAVYSVYDQKPPKDWIDAFLKVRLDPYGGRLTLLKNDDNVTILADYAHEKYSLVEVANLARKISSSNKVIGVVRLAYDRTDEMIEDTGKYIANSYDSFVVYEKIDGYWRQPKTSLRSKKFPKQIVGHVSKILFDSIKKSNPNAVRILREDEALEKAAQIAAPGDVVVMIVNDNIRRSLKFIKQAFRADFV